MIRWLAHALAAIVEIVAALVVGLIVAAVDSVAFGKKDGVAVLKAIVTLSRLIVVQWWSQRPWKGANQ